ncbi:MAG: 30S ribosomal protein S1 [Thermodesulfobacteriota bacterium]
MTEQSNEQSFADLFNESTSETKRTLTPGDKIRATVVGMAKETIFLDIGGKSEGLLDAAEVKDENNETAVAIGDRLEVYFLKSTGSEKIFTIKLGSGRSTDHLEEAFRSEIPVEGFVKGEIKGGFEITLGGSIRAFCPYSQMGLRRVEDAAAEYTEQHMSFLITRFEESGRNIVVSARALQEIERERRREELQETLQEGQTIDGVISAVREFGAFVDIGGIDGLVPISEIGWSRVENIHDYLVEGQEVKVLIKGLDWEGDRISLSIKETLTDPWDTAAQTFGVGTNHIGKVVRLTNFGAFVSLSDTIDGLVHISKLGGGRRINHPREVLEEGQNLEVTIEDIDQDARRISLSPADYVSPESEEAEDRKQYQKFVKTSHAKDKKDNGSLGTLGELLKAKMAEKGS